MNNSIYKAIGILALAGACATGPLHADNGDSWEFGAAIYGWFPDISGKTAFSLDGDGSDFKIDVGDILDNLQFTFQGSFDARKGQWGLFTDVIYMDLGKTRSELREGTIGGRDIPVSLTADVRFDMKSWIWTTAGYFRAVDEPGKTLDLLGGFRYADVEQSLNWRISGDIGQLPLPGREGGGDVGADYWDLIVGLRGRLGFGTDYAWFLPYYLDVGTGDSDYTWQAAAGLGYAFSWGEIAGVWRYLSYDMPSGKPIADMNFSGPAVGVIFRW